MKFPMPLRKGELIGVTAPSSGLTEPLDIVRLEHAKDRLESMGYGVTETPNVRTDEAGRSSPAKQRVDELYDLLLDNGVGAIIAASGGDYENEMLMFMDWDLLERYPKWIQGYSDNTVLLFKITVDMDIATIYAGNFCDFGMEPLHRSLLENLEFLEGRRTEQTSFDMYQDGFRERVTGTEGISGELPVVWSCDKGDASFSGRLIGGCSDVLDWYRKMANVNVPRFVERYADDGIVWYMETFEADDDRLKRMFEGMIRDGWFANVTGFVFGRPIFYKGEDYEGVVKDCLKGFDVPKVFGADVGHKPPRMTFINGAKARFDIKDGKARLSYDLS